MFLVDSRNSEESPKPMFKILSELNQKKKGRKIKVFGSIYVNYYNIKNKNGN